MIDHVIDILQSLRTPKKYNILVIGCRGQLGQCLEKFLKHESALRESCVGVVIGYDFPEIDVSSIESLEAKIHGTNKALSIKFDYVINCSAITDTTKIEIDQNTRDLSYKVNVLGPKHLAQVCQKNNCKLIHISTDYVFSEKSGDIPDDEFPVNEYGVHKLLGEKMIESIFGACSPNFMILRTSWLYGNSLMSFPMKFLKKCINILQTPDSIVKSVEVVDDCFGRPTSVQYLARFILLAIKNQAYGKMDAQSKTKPISRFEFASMIQLEIAHATRDPKIEQMLATIAVIPCSSSNFAGSKIRHPLKMPNALLTYIDGTTNTCEFMTTQDMTMPVCKLLDIIDAIQTDYGLHSDPSGMLEDWLVKFDGIKTIEDQINDH